MMRALADHRSALAASLYKKAWTRWPRRAIRRTPVGDRLHLAGEAEERAARRVDAGLFAFDEEDGVEFLPDPTWRRAMSATLEAVMGVGATDLCTSDEASALVASWQTCFGEPLTDPPPLNDAG